MKKYILMAVLLCSSTNILASNSSLGVGLGIPYGLLGLNLNYQINEYVDLTAGVGVGIGVGLRFHPLSSIKEFRITTFYGTNSAIKTSVLDTTETETFSGYNIGVGYGALSDGWDVDLIYIIIPDSLNDRLSKLKSQGYRISGDITNKVAFSLGYHW